MGFFFKLKTIRERKRYKCYTMRAVDLYLEAFSLTTTDAPQQHNHRSEQERCGKKRRKGCPYRHIRPICNTTNIPRSIIKFWYIIPKMEEPTTEMRGAHILRRSFNCTGYITSNVTEIYIYWAILRPCQYLGCITSADGLTDKLGRAWKLTRPNQVISLHLFAITDIPADIRTEHLLNVTAIPSCSNEILWTLSR